MKKPKGSKFNNLSDTPVAIIGMSAHYPGANTVEEYWNNILNKVDSIEDVPASRWDVEDYFESDSYDEDKTYCKKGGFLSDVNFNPLEFGIPPHVVEATDFSQLLGLLLAKTALDDAGYRDMKNVDNDRVGIIIGASSMKTLVLPLANRMQYPLLQKILKSSGLTDDETEAIVEKMKFCFNRWQENTFPGLLTNIISGRIAKSYNFGGINCTVDAACASSLGAVKMAVGELLEGRCDMMITGGIDTDSSAFTYMCFCASKALSKNNAIRPFDKNMDGTILGEGGGLIVVKRLADAERDKDKIYAVIRGIGATSDGNSKVIYAPDSEGQIKTLQNAYAGLDALPESVALIEAHGTGTQIGDLTEFEALKSFFNHGEFSKNHIALGSVKSQIGHTKAAAGAAGLIKAALALNQGVLPPTINITKPHPKLEMEDSSFYLNTKPRPWIRVNQTPRRAGVSSFGFGGVNFHVVLEEYMKQEKYRVSQNRQDSILLWANNPEELLNVCQKTLRQLSADREIVHYRLVEKSTTTVIPLHSARVGFVAGSVDEVSEVLLVIIDRLKLHPSENEWVHPRGIFYRSAGIDIKGRVVALFPGQGSQYPEMGLQTAIDFPIIQEIFASMDELFLNESGHPLSDLIYPKSLFNESLELEQKEKINRTEYAQPAIGSLNMGYYKILTRAGFEPDFLAGHSFGEYSALWAAGVFSDEGYQTIIKQRGRIMADFSKNNKEIQATGMMAVKGDMHDVERICKEFPNVTIANRNSGKQVILAGYNVDLDQIQNRLAEINVTMRPLKVSQAFHTPLISPIEKPIEKLLKTTPVQAPEKTVFSNLTGGQYPKTPDEIIDILKRHVTHPVQFKDEIESIYNSGGYVFVECGPKKVLTNLVKEILKDKPHVALALNPDANSNAKKDSTQQLQEAVTHLRVVGVPLMDIFPSRTPSVQSAESSRKGMNISLDAGNNYTHKMNLTEVLNDGFKIQSREQESERGHLEAVAPDITDAQETNYRRSVGVENNSSTDALLVAIQEQQQTITKIHEAFLDNQFEHSKNIMLLNSVLSKHDPTSRKQISEYIDTYMKQQTDMVRLHEKYFDYLKLYDKSIIDAIENGSGPKLPSIEKITTDENISTTTEEKGVVVTNTSQVITNGTPASSTNTESDTDSIQIITPEEAEKTVLSVISEKTGYPIEMLELDMDIDSDLGIDSIKRLEIISAIMTRHPELSQANQEELTQLHTLNDIAQFMTCQDILPEGKHEIPEEKPAYSFVAAPATIPEPEATFEEVEKDVFDIITEKTGYPTDILELDMDIDSDLGIDSIKRLEILNAIVNRYPNVPQDNQEDLVHLQTLNDIVHYLVKYGSTASDNKKNKPTVPLDSVDDNTEATTTTDIQNVPVVLRRLPDPDRREIQFNSDCVALITADGTETTIETARLLLQQGCTVIVLDLPKTPEYDLCNTENEPIVHERLETCREAVIREKIISIVNTFGTINLFIHLHPRFDDIEDLQGVSETWRSNEKQLLKQIFLLAKYLKAPLNKAAETGLGCFFSVTRLDGNLGFGIKGKGSPFSGGLNGLVKSLNQEWPQVFCRAVDLEPDLDAATSARYILSEFHDSNRIYTEVGYCCGERVTLYTGMKCDLYTQPNIDSNSVFLVSGGGKGITAACVVGMAKEFKCKFILLGRSEYSKTEPDWTQGCTAEPELKKRIMEKCVENGEKATPKYVERIFNQISSRRKIHQTLQAIKKAGGTAHYISVDITDCTMMEEKLLPLKKRLQEITGIIHGAGVLADKFIERKTEDDFEQVLSVKVDGLFNLIHCVEAAKLKHIFMFSSTAGFYGNIGQTDYACANEILNKSANMLKKYLPESRILSINWGPWESGMVNATLKKAFEERNIHTISMKNGVRIFIKAISLKSPDIRQIVAGAPLPQALTAGLNNGRNVRIIKRVDLLRNPILQEHVIGDAPVLPTTFAMLDMANACHKLQIEGYLFKCLNMKVLKGIVFDTADEFVYSLDIKEKSDDPATERKYLVKTWSEHNGKQRFHYSAEMFFVNDLPALVKILSTEKHLCEIDGDELYRNGTLFHGPHFRGIKTILHVNELNLTMKCNLPNGDEGMEGQYEHIAFNPLIADTLLQGLVVWIKAVHKVAGLPLEIKECRFYRPVFYNTDYYVSVDVVSDTGTNTIANIVAYDQDGNVHLEMIEAVVIKSEHLTSRFESWESQTIESNDTEQVGV